MKHKLNFWVVGGDRRQVSLARLLAGDGHAVHICALGEVPDLPNETSLKAIGAADCVILPLPVSSGKGLLNAPLEASEQPLSLILDRLNPGQFLCGGRIDRETEDLALERGLTIHDYFAREELAVANAVPTAEGAIQLAMEHLPITIHGSKVLITGFGRVGRLTAQRFQVLGARVTVAARKYAQLAWAQAMGMDTVRLEPGMGWSQGYDFIVNTVPAQVLGQAELEDVNPGCLILDLASQPGGVNLTASEKLGVTILQAQSLPGKVAPVTAGAAIRDTIYHMLWESGF